jgi:phage tail-like protein
MSLGERVDSAPACWFEIHVGHDQWMIVQSVSGLGASWDQTPLQIWEDAGHYRYVPTKMKWTNLVLKGAVVDQLKFFDWFKKVQIGAINKARQDVVIHVKRAGKTLGTWTATGAFPVKYTGPTFDVNSTTIAFETIELTHLGIERND